MAVEEVKISSDVAHVFINGANKEAKEQITQKLINSGYGAEEQSQRYVQILMFPIQS